jgi:flagellar basal body rod protein FlgG
MIYGMYLSTMGAMAQAARHQAIANNLANAETAGFKPDAQIFRHIPVESRMGGGPRTEVDRVLENTGGGVWVDHTTTDFSPGPFRETGNVFDIALDDGSMPYRSFLPVRRPGTEEVLYTRDGHLSLNNEGQLVHRLGYEVLSAEGEPILLPGVTEARILQDGTIVDVETNLAVAQIGVLRTTEPLELEKLGGNLYAAGEATLEPNQAHLRSGFIEESATDPVREMAAMIEAQRTYESNMMFLRIQDETLGDTVGRVGATA